MQKKQNNDIATAQQPAELILIEDTRTIMATMADIHVAVPPEQEMSARKAIDACFSWLDEVETCLTRFRPESELCQLNAAAGSWQNTSDLLFTMLEESLAAASASDGLFDPTLLSLLEALGYDRDFSLIAHREAAAEWRVAHRPPLTGAWRHIQLDKRRHRVRLPLGTKLDFGGIAKGWAADVALGRFFNGYDNVLINLGGDMRVRGGAGDDKPWPIGIGRSALDAKRPEDWPLDGIVVTLACGGLAASGAADRWWYRLGERQHHLLDPRLGGAARVWVGADAKAANGPVEQDSLPEEHLIASATAFAPTAAHAEVAAKVALLRGYPNALQVIEHAWEQYRVDQATPSPAAIQSYGDVGVALLLILDTGEAACSANLEDYLATLGGGGNLWLT